MCVEDIELKNLPGSYEFTRVDTPLLTEFPVNFFRINPNLALFCSLSFSLSPSLSLSLSL